MKNTYVKNMKMKNEKNYGAIIITVIFNYHNILNILS